MKIIVCGGRAYKERDVIFARLDALHKQNEITELVQGGASGADELAAEWAKENGVKLSTFTAQWKLQGRAAGPIRNQRMIDGGAMLLVYFPGGAGTADCKRKAEQAGIPTLDGARQPRSPLFVKSKKTLTPREQTMRQLHAICARHDLTFAEARSKARHKRVIDARWECLEYLRYERRWSLPEIGRMFNLDHSTVHHALRESRRRRAEGRADAIKEWRGSHPLTIVDGDAA